MIFEFSITHRSDSVVYFVEWMVYISRDTMLISVRFIGTTGKPKGTIIPHQAFCTSATAFTRRMNINATSRTFQFASYTFDASCIEILSALMVGATVCVPSEEERMNDTAGAICKYKANWSLLTPSVLGTIDPSSVPCLKTLVSGGEALPGSILKKWGTSACLINGKSFLPDSISLISIFCSLAIQPP